MIGPILRTFADRVLNRDTGAEQTRQTELGYWDEHVTLPHITHQPLGIGDRFGWQGVRTLTRAEVGQWLQETQRRPGARPGTTLSASQVRQRFYLLRKIIREAIDTDHLDTDPTAGLRPPPLPQGRAVTGLMRREKDRRWLPTDDQMRAVCDALPARSRAAIGLLFGAGLRAGELTALTPGDVTRHGPGRYTVSITKSESQSRGRPTSGTKTGAAGQAVRHLPVWVGVLLDEHLAALPADAARLFPPVRDPGGPSLSHTVLRTDLRRALTGLGWGSLTLQDLRAAGEAAVAAVIGRPAAAAWARHSLQVSMAHYVAEEGDRHSAVAAGWGTADTPPVPIVVPRSPQTPTV